MYIPDKEQDQQIRNSIQEYRDDMSIGFDKIRLQLYEYTCQIAYPVYGTEDNSRRVAEHILQRLEQNIDKVDMDSDFYPWYGEFCAYRIYRMISNRKGGIYHKDKHGRTYRFQSVNEDPVLKEAGLAYLESNHGQDNQHLHIAQRLLLVMYVLLALNVEEIADLCQARKAEISGELAGISATLSGKRGKNKEEPGFVDLIFPKLSKKSRLLIDLAASAILIAIFVMKFIL